MKKPFLKTLVKPSRLIPMAIIGFAVGVAIQTQSPVAHAATTAVDGNRGGVSSGDTDPDVKAVGSGRENYYVPKTTGLPDVPNPGEYLFVQGCSTCHGLNGEGSVIDGKTQAPSLIGVGAAAVDFYVSTGRMPLAQPVVQAPRKKPLYTPVQIQALAQYVSTTFGGGTAIPTILTDQGNLVDGNQLYANNCAACHNSAGSGGALGRNYYAPRLTSATALQTGEAIRIGPGAMPVFGPDTFSDQQVNSIVKYVGTLKTANNPGGLRLGGVGPVPEGFFGWVVGLGLVLGVARWIGTRV